MKRVLLSIAAITAGLAVFAGPAVACGGLVGENGTIQLVRTATLAAYHDGVERYVTSFEFVGEGAEVGSIIPLPDVPTSVERGGDWTLQRLGPRSCTAEARIIRTSRHCRRRVGQGDPRDEDRRTRHHRARRRRAGRWSVGARARLLPDARRAGGAGVLRVT